MTIRRGNCTATLTSHELFEAFYEQQHKFDVETIRGGIDRAEEFWGISAREPEMKIVSQMADDFRDLLDEEPFISEMEALHTIIERFFCQDLE